MAKAKRKDKPNATGRNDRSSRFLKLEHWMLKSPAWRCLSSHAKNVLIEVWVRYNGVNNGEIAYAVRDAEQIGLSKDQAARALAECQEKGFLVVTQESAFNIKTRISRTWRITALPTGEKGEIKSTNEFMRWRPPQAPNPETSNKARSRQQDAQSHQRDRGTIHATNGMPSVAPARPLDPETLPPQSHQRDTYTCHGGVESGGTTDATTPSPTRQRDRGRDSHGTVADPRQVDLEEWLGGPVGGEVPMETLRTDLDKHLKAAPKGEAPRLADECGVSRPQILNFRAGRFGLNLGAARRLRQILDERGLHARGA